MSPLWFIVPMLLLGAGATVASLLAGKINASLILFAGVLANFAALGVVKD